MPKRSTTDDGTVDRDELHPVGVAGDPAATNPHEADPTPNTQETARRRVNVGIVDEFEVVGDLPANARTRSAPQGRQLNDGTANALQFLRQHKGSYCKVGEWEKPGSPSERLKWMGYYEDGSEPTPEQEKRANPNDYATRKKIAYTYRPNDKGTYDLLLCLTDDDWTPPKKRKPKAQDDVNTTTTDNPNVDDDDVPVDEEMEPTEAQG
jgi:hypothetical protein